MRGVAGQTSRMERGLAARLRPLGFLELMSYLFPVIGLFLIRDVVNGSVPVEHLGAALWFVAFVGAPIAVRVLVATEYVEATSEGLRWRSLFLSRSLPWDRVAQIGTGEMWLFPLLVSSMYLTDLRVVKVRLTNGRVRRVRASAWNRRHAHSWLCALPVVIPTRVGQRPPSFDGTITLDPSLGS